MKIDILIGDNLYGTACHFSKSLADALKRQGVTTRLFWIADGYFYQAFYAILADPPDFTCSFSDISLQGKPLGSLWSIPHLSMLLDPPIYFLHQMRCHDRSWLSCVDAGDFHFLEQLGCARCFFLPHGAEKSLETPVDNPRPYQAVFFGSCLDYEALAQSWPTASKNLLWAAAERVLSSEGVSIAKALIDLNVDEKLLPRYHDAIDQYIRGRDRVEMIRGLVEREVWIWGAGPWKKYLPSHHIAGPVSFEKSLEIMKASQLVLNSSPRFKQGLHERIVYAFMCGAAVYTGRTDYLKEVLPEVMSYEYGSWQAELRDDWQAAARAGQQRVSTAHTWDQRASTLIAEVTKWLENPRVRK